jgi:tetratricopeptide (TPR) repeat protein
MAEQKSSVGKTGTPLSGQSPSGNRPLQQMLVRAEQLIHGNKMEEAESLLSAVSENPDAEYWFLKGFVNQKVQQWSEAMNCYHKCLDLEPGHPKASAGLEICQGILGFWNPSLFNP